MDLRQLRYFLAITEHGSFSRAAERLRVAQPALSLHIRKLEEELGVELLVRTPRGIRPTESGEQLAAHARLILGQVDSAREAIRENAAEPRGRVTIGIGASLGPVLTVPLVEAVRRTCPGVSLRIAEGLSGHVLEWLLSGQADLLVSSSAGPAAGITSEATVVERLFLFAPAGDPAAAALASGRSDGGVPVAGLAGLPLVLPGRPHRLREQMERAARKAGIELSVTVEVDALDHMKSLAARGVGYTVLPLCSVHEEAVSGRLAAYPLTAPALRRSIYLAHATERPLGSAARHVRGLLKAMFAELTDHGRWRLERAWLKGCG